MFKIKYGTLNGDGDIYDLTCHEREAKKYEYEFEGETNIGYALPSHLAPEEAAASLRACLKESLSKDTRDAIRDFI